MRFIGNVEQDTQIRAVASGTLSNGDTVVVNSDGTVSAVSGSSVSATTGSATVYETGQTSWTAATYDSNSNKVVIAYNDSDNNQYGTAVVGTVSGTSISFGTPVVFQTSVVFYVTATFDSNANKVVIAYHNNGSSGQGTAIVGTVSGTSISFGTAVVFETGNTVYTAATFDTSNSKVVIAYRDASNSNYGTAVVGTVSGTSISFGTPSVFESATSNHVAIAFDSSNNKVVVAYQIGTTGYGTARVGTVSGTTISFGGSVSYSINTNGSAYTSMAYDTNSNKVIVVYNKGAPYQCYGIVGTVSGTTISFGTEVNINSSQSDYSRVVYNAAANKLVVVYSDTGNSSYLTGIEGQVSGTSLIFGSEFVLDNTGSSSYMSIAYDANQQVSVVSYAPVASTNKGTGIVRQTAYSSTNVTAENFIGFADSGYVDGQNVGIDSTGSVNRSQSGLTAGQKYYVQNDGSLSTTAGDPSVEAGVAISATEILVKG